MKNTSFFERIMQIIDYYNISNINEFAKEYLGYSSSEKINRLKKEGNNPSYDILLDISNKFENINMNWLLTGNGEMLKNSNEVEINSTAKEPEAKYTTSHICNKFAIQ